MAKRRVMTKADVDDFMSQKTLAIVGASRNWLKFGNMAYRQLKDKGYRVFPVNPNADTVEGDRCYPSLSALPERPGGAVIVVHPRATEQVVRDAAAAGIQRVWMQQGSYSEDAARFCEQNGIRFVHGHCVLMFAEPAAFYHRFHSWLWKLIGRLPQ